MGGQQLHPPVLISRKSSCKQENISMGGREGGHLPCLFTLFPLPLLIFPLPFLLLPFLLPFPPLQLFHFIFTDGDLGFFQGPYINGWDSMFADACGGSLVTVMGVGGAGPGVQHCDWVGWGVDVVAMWLVWEVIVVAFKAVNDYIIQYRQWTFNACHNLSYKPVYN